MSGIEIKPVHARKIGYRLQQTLHQVDTENVLFFTEKTALGLSKYLPAKDFKNAYEASSRPEEEEEKGAETQATRNTQTRGVALTDAVPALVKEHLRKKRVVQKG